MGAGASAGLSAALQVTSQSDLEAVLDEIPEDNRKRLAAILSSGPLLTQTPSKWKPPAEITPKPIYGPDLSVVGSAPFPDRPPWLPKSGPGQARVDPLCWGLSVEQWIFFVRSCTLTDTWKALVESKNEYTVTMYDMRDHFVVPWTVGTGCSVSLLMNSACPQKIDLMLSHAWGGSVVETYNCLQNLVNHRGVSSTTVVFYCNLSMYQPEDGATGGLTIGQQLALKPFAKIIEAKPLHGMFVLHTTTFEVYSRMWTVHEVDEAVLEEIDIRGLFDMYRWGHEKFNAALSIDTSNSQCRPEDKLFLSELIASRGGFSRLDKKITTFRKQMEKEMDEFLKRTMEKDDDEPHGKEEREHYFKGDWWKGCLQVDRDDDGSERIEWKYHKSWKQAMARVGASLTADLKDGDDLIKAYPLGDDGCPFGPAGLDGWVASSIEVPTGFED